MSSEIDFKGSLISAAVAVAIAKFYFEVEGNAIIPFVNVPMDASLMIGVAVAGADMLADVSKVAVSKYIPAVATQYAEAETLSKPLVAGVATYGALKLFVSADARLVPALAIGGVSSVTGSYVSNAMKMY